jgi:aryl-alcohol dehydrogenase-like predicted oxidoreductase
VDYITLGDSDLKVSRVIFGAWAIGGWKWGGADEDRGIAAIQRAMDVGINAIDTAPIYGFGRSESLVGRAIAGRRDELLLATKCGLRWDLAEGERFFETEDEEGNERTVYRDLRPESVLEEIERSLERLGADYVDLYQCHWPDSTTPIGETMDAMARILEAGKARAIGVSNFTPRMIDECRRHGTITSDQPLFNMLDRDVEEDVLPYCAEHGVGVICYSPLHQGLLTGEVTMDRQFNEGDQRNDKPWFQPENRRRVLAFLDKVRPIAEGHGRTLAQVAINWCLCQRGISAAIVGARRPEQVEENAGGTGWQLTGEELQQIRGWLAELDGPQ